MYLAFDMVYGKERTLPKFKVLEMLARYPYWAWENGSYHRLSKLYARSTKVPDERTKALWRIAALGRDSQDNEQHHLMLIEDIVHQKGIKLGWLRHGLIPRVLAFGYYHLTRFMYCVRPAWSFHMNAAFESHAEHEYMLMARENPAWDSEEVDSVHFKYYPRQVSLGALIRRIALDERDHMNHSLEEIERLNRGDSPPATAQGEGTA